MNQSSNKAQRAMARDRYYRQQRERAAWVRSLPPEHRAIHEGDHPSPFCSFCMNESARRAGESMARAMAAIRVRA